MAQNRFKAFLKEGQPFGDAVDRPFVNDAVTDLRLPDPKSWEELEDYIKRTNPDAPADTLNAARHVWQLYEADVLGKTD
ncbi:MAG: hypothetical protein IH905_14255 [Proteobacteria bacterium]|nr:hypothetical protein [Pseudomonadota bacterium]